MELRGNVFCFVGKFPVDTRPIRKILEREGARITDFADPELRVVILGTDARSKEKAATKRGLVIVSWPALLALVAKAAPAPRRSAPARPRPRTPLELVGDLDELEPTDDAAIADTIARAQDLDVTVDLRAGDATTTRDAAWLLAWCSDADGCSFFVIPEAVLDDARRADLRAIRGLCFADGRDTPPDRLGAAIRVLAGMTSLLGRDRDVLARELFDGWRAELDGHEDAARLHGPGDLQPLFGWIAACYAPTLADVRRPFTHVIAVNQAM